MSAVSTAIAVFVLGLVLTALWYTVSGRRKAESALGVQALATMKWRDCSALILEALQREGYKNTPDSVSGSGGSEFLLTHKSGRVLLGYKHGTAYRLTEQSVRDFGSSLPIRGASSGILVTLGSADSSAMTAARSSNIEVMDGSALWPRIRPILPEGMLAELGEQAAARTRKSLWLGLLVSLLAAGATFISSARPEPAVTPSAATTDGSAAVVAPIPGAPDNRSVRADDDIVRQLNATAKAMADVAKLTPDQRAKRRADAAKLVSQLEAVDSAAWSAQSTLLLNLNQSDGKDKVLIDEACRILTQYEEMRFTRVQLQPPQNSAFPVRWHLCD